jgi:phospholipid/cholesterol/gamma-HCH transport system substrate-binding protein
MAKQVSKTFIGAFVLSALALLVMGVILFGGGKLFKTTHKFIMFFEGSVKGLSVGSPVVFRGVEVGSVEDIFIHADPKTYTINIPVIISLEPDRIKMEEGKITFNKIDKAIAHGFKAQLTSQSMLTGQLIIELDFYPDKSIELVGTKMPYPEIPTIPSTVQEIGKTLQKIPIDEIALQLANALKKFGEVLSAPEIDKIFKNVEQASYKLRTLIQDTDKLINNANSRINPLAGNLDMAVDDARQLMKNTDNRVTSLSDRLEHSIEQTSTAANNALEQAKKTLALNDGVPSEIAANLNGALNGAQDAMEQARQTLLTIQQVSDPDSKLIYETSTALKELSSAARAFRAFAEYLERHPEALLRGKSGTGGQ